MTNCVNKDCVEYYSKGNFTTVAFMEFNDKGDFDFNVVIRSITYNAKNNYLSFMVGGAITALSDPEKEYEECLLKAKAMLEVLDPEHENVQMDKVQETAIPTKALYETDRREYYRLRSYYMQFDKAKIHRFYERSGNLFLWLKGVYYLDDQIYVQFRIENQEGVDLDVNFLKFSIATAYKKSSSNQKTEILPVFRYKVPERIEGNSENHFVIAFDFIVVGRDAVGEDVDEEGAGWFEPA